MILMHTKIRINILLFITLFCGINFADFARNINKILSDQTQANSVFGIQIIDVSSGKAVYSRNETMPLMPASNMKIFTSIAAIKILGEDYVFRTGIYFENNDIVVKGSGDPLLGDRATLEKNGKQPDWQLQQIAEAVKAAGITSFGNIIVDSSVFDDILIHPAWPVDQLNRDYAPEVCGINYRGNCVEVIAYPSGSAVAYEVVPKTNYVNITNRATFTTERQNTVWVSRAFESNNMTLFGKCYTRALPIRVTVHRPAVYFGYILAEKLLSEGISIEGSIMEKHRNIGEGAVKLVEFGNSLEDVVMRCNSDSFNLAAEALAKKISAARTANNIGGQWEHAGEIISELLRELNIKTDGFVFDDGCGLSRNNRVSADMTARLLLYMYKSPRRQFFIDTLAVGGVRGSSPVSSNFTEPEYKGRVFAKSGTISGVRALSGYCQTDNGEYVFSVFVNNANWKSRQVINDIVKAIFSD